MWFLFAEEPQGTSLISIIVATVFGSGGLIALIAKYLDQRGKAKIAEAIRLAEIAADERVKVEALRADEAERINKVRTEAANDKFHEYKDVVALLQQEIARLQRIDKEHRVSMRDELVFYREEIERLKKSKESP